MVLILGVGLTALSSGCVDPLTIFTREGPHREATKTAARQRPPAVYPNQVTDDNAHGMAQALQAEIEFDAQPDVPDAKAPATR
jgi:hypothetical protein